METETLKRIIANNIATIRKDAGLTQAELAERLNYSDKAVSKWERGESLPDVVTLVKLARACGASVGKLITLTDEGAERGPEAPAAPDTAPDPSTARPRLGYTKRVVAGLVTVLVWFLAVLAFVILSEFRLPGSWLGFLAAVPANAVVLLSLFSAWRHYRWNQVIISVMMWGTLLTVFVTLWLYADLRIPRLFLLGLPGQLAIYLWFRLYKK